MSIIEFENGIRVEVEGKPTPEDVEEIWQQVKDRKPPQQPKQPEKKGFLSRVKEDIVERGKQFGESIERQQKGQQGLPSTLLQLGGETAGAVGDILGEGLVSVGRGISKVPGAKPLGRKIADEIMESPVAREGLMILGDNLNFASEEYQRWKEKNPVLAENIESVLNISALLPIGKGAQIAAKEIKAGAKGFAELAERTALRFGEAVDERRLLKIDKAKKGVDELVGKIVQGKVDDIPAAKRALSDIDTTGIKTYQQLGSKVDDQVEALSRKLDEFLDEQPGTLKGKELIVETTVGNKTATQNFVDDALEQLDELYATTKDAPLRLRVQNLKDKLASEGLTRRELNDLAREYGVQFRSKAFNQRTGDALTSVNAQAFENTRKGLKETVRSKIDGDIPKELDSRISDLLETSRLVGRMEERVNSLWQKVQRRGLLERAARKVADIVDVATFKTFSGFISRMLPSNVGLKTMNSIDLERALGKNLNKLDALLQEADDDQFIFLFRDLVEEVKKPLPKVPGVADPRPTAQGEFRSFGAIPDDLTTSISKAKASGQSFDEWVKGQ